MDSKPGHRRGRSLGEGLKLEESEKGAGPHRRGRSLGEGLKLEESEKGALVVSGINNASSASQGLKEGDEIVGATIHFDELSKEDVLKLLKLIEPFDEKVEVLTKNKLRPSLGTCLKTPEEMLNDSYNRLYNDKIKRFMKDDTPAGVVEGKLKANAARPQWSEPSLKGDNRSPQKDKKTLQVEVPSSLRSPDLPEPFSGSSGDESHDDSLNVLLPRLGLNLPEAEGGVSRFNTAASSPNLHATDHCLTGTFPEGPDINIRPDGKMPGAEHPQVMVAPNVSLSKAGLEIPGLDSEGPEVNVLDKGLCPLEGNITVQTVDINAPRLDIEGMNNKCEMPKFKIPDLGLSGPNISEPDCSAPGFDHTPKLDLNAPDVNMKTPSGKVRVQSVKKVKNHTLNVDDPSSYLPVKLPKVRLSGKVPKGQDQDIDTSFKTSNVDLRGPMMDASLPNPDIKSLKGDLKLSDADIDDLKTLDLNLSAPKIDVPDCSLPSSGKLKMPDFGFSGTLPKTQDLDLDADVKTPNLSLKAPKIKGGVNITDMGLPQVDLKTPKVDINTPEVDMNAPSGKLKRSKFKMPTFGLSRLQGPDIGINGNLEEPNLGFSSPKFKSEMSDPKLDISLVNHKSLGIDVDGPSGKFKVPSFKMPDFSLSGPKAMASDSELKMPDLGLSGHELKKELSPPDLSMPDIDLKGPNAPDIKIGMPSGKFNTPTLKNPDTNLSVPGIEADAPSGKFKMPKIFGTLSRWPDVGFTAADLSLKAPSTKGGIDGPDLDLPNMDIKTSTLNTDIGSPKGKFKLPKLRLPNYDLSGLKEQNFNMDGDLDRPNVGLPKPVLDIDAPSLDLKGLKTDLKMPSNFDLPSGKVKTPTLNLKKPKMDVNTLGLDVDAPSGKFKLPKFKMPTFSLSGLKGPDIDIDGEAPDVDINTPQVNVKSPKMDLKMPDGDMGSPPSKFKLPGLKMPDFGLTGPNIERPDFDLNPPDLDLSAPKLKGRIGPSDLKLPKADLNTPKLDLNGPDINLNMPSGKLRVPTLKKPKVELGALDFNVDTPSGKLKMPTLDVSGTLPKGPSLDIKPSVKKTDLSLKGPKIKGGIDAPDFNLPNIDSKLDGNTPNLDIASPKTKLKMPKLKMPTFGFSGPKGPGVDVNGDLEGPDLNIPHSDVSSPSGKFKIPSFKMPGFGLSGPKVTGPDMDLSAPEVKGGICLPDMDFPNAQLKDPKLDLKQPDVNLYMPPVTNLKAPKPDMNSPDVGIHFPTGKFKTPTLKMPKCSLSGLSGQDAELNGGIEGLGNEMPLGNIRGPQTDFDLPEKKIKLPSLKMPQFGGPDLKRIGSDVDFGTAMKSPDMIMSPPTATYDVKEPNLRGTVAATEFTSNINTSFPKAAIESPKLHPKASELDIDAPSSKHRMPRSKHKSDISGPNVKIPVLDIDADVKWTHTDKRSRKVKGRPSYPVVDADLPKADLTEMDRRAPDLNIDDISDKFHILKPKMSNLDQSHAEILDINSDSSPKIPVPKLPTPKNYEQGMVVSQPGLNFSSKTDLQSHPQHRNATAREIDQTKRAKSTKKSGFGISMPDLTFNPDLKSPEDPEGYYVTVFPKQLKTEVRGQTKVADRKVANRKSATLGRLDFSASNVDLEVPEENDLKGSTFWFSKLI